MELFLKDSNCMEGIFYAFYILVYILLKTSLISLSTSLSFNLLNLATKKVKK